MTPDHLFPDKNVALFGLGGSGFASGSGACCRRRTSVGLGRSRKPRATRPRCVGLNVADLQDADWTQFSSFVLAPGVPLTHPEPHWSVIKAKEAGVEIIGDIELFCRERRCHRARGRSSSRSPAPMASRRRRRSSPISSRPSAMTCRSAAISARRFWRWNRRADHRVHVIECSSFQIDLTPSHQSLGRRIAQS